MFYTLASKLLIKGPVQGREFLFVFLAGSVMYVALHWYLHLDQKTGIVEQVKKYLYYAMAVDLAVAYVMVSFFAPAAKTEDESDDKPKTKREYTDEEKKAIMARMQEARRQQMKQANQAQNGNNPGAQDDSNGNPQPNLPPIDPRTGLPMGMDPRALLNMDPRNPPPGVDPRIIHQFQVAHAARLAKEMEDEEESEISEKSSGKKRKSAQKPTPAPTGKTGSKTDSKSGSKSSKSSTKSQNSKKVTSESDPEDSDKQEKRSIFSRSDESKTDSAEDLDDTPIPEINPEPEPEPEPQPAKKLRVKKKNDEKSRDKESGSNLEDTEIPMFS